MIVRNFQLKDYTEVIDLWRESGLNVGISDSIQEIKKKLERDPDLFLVAEDSEGIIAAVLGAWDGRRAWVYHLAVAQRKRHENIGTSIMQELENRFRRKGALKINLMADRHNENVKAFYAGLGYYSEDVVYMTKKLF